MIFARLIPPYFGQIFCHINILIASWVFNGRGINLSHDINPSLMALQAEVSPHHDRGKIPLSPIKPNYATNIRGVVLRGDEEKKTLQEKRYWYWAAIETTRYLSRSSRICRVVILTYSSWDMGTRNDYTET